MRATSFGDPDWTVTITPIGLGRHEYTVHRYTGDPRQAWRVRATFASNDDSTILDARKIAGSAGTVALFARIHLALKKLRQLPKTAMVMDSQQVHELTGEPLPVQHKPELPGQLDALDLVREENHHV